MLRDIMDLVQFCSVLLSSDCGNKLNKSPRIDFGETCAFKLAPIDAISLALRNKTPL